MSEALTRIEQPGTLDAPARKRAIDELLNKVALVMETMDRVMADGVHYGKIPGAGDKKVLFKAGAEKLGLTFHLKPTFDVMETDLGNHHRNFRVICTLTGGAEGVGSCSTLEKKYRYRKRYENGKVVGEMENENPADCWNTCLKMAKKRAHVDAIITATASSDILTQDVDDVVEAADATEREKPTVIGGIIVPRVAPAPDPEGRTSLSKPKPPVAEQWKEYFLKDVAKKGWGIFAWHWAVLKGYLKDVDKLSSISPVVCPQNLQEHAKVMADIRAVMDSFPKGVSQELGEKYTQAHLDELGPQESRDGGKEEQAWKSVVLHFGPNKGMTLGEMSKELPKKLWGWWKNFQPEPWKGQLKQIDVDLRAALDAAGEYMGYENKEEKPESAPAGLSEVRQTNDDVPF